MVIAVLGKGKTGSEVIRALNEKGYQTEVFGRERPLTHEALKASGAKAIISFIPGPELMPYLAEILASKIPLISGHTGLATPWPTGIPEATKAQGVTWAHAHNYSLGMVVAKSAIEALAQAMPILPEATFAIHETHHTQKKDAPSGTALAWKQWLGPTHHDTPITSAREGDVVGYHRLVLATQSEEIQLSHTAHSRRLFADGAVWMMERILAGEAAPGLITFESWARQYLFNHLPPRSP